MIKSIYVKNFVLIDTLNLDFDHCFSCFTGETGAGKSLLIDAISILCGGRVSHHSIQKGADKGFIEAVFEVKKDHPCLSILEENGFDVEENTFIISREFSIEGKSVARINHRQTTLGFIREITSSLVDIHSQHDTQYLLNSKYHLGLLDEYIHEDEKCKQVKHAYKEYSKVKKERTLFEEQEINANDLDYLTYQLNEMNTITLTEKEYHDLENKIKEMSAFEKNASSIKEAIKYIDSCSHEKLYDAAKLLQNNSSEQISKIQEDIMDLYYSIEDQKERLVSYMNEMEFDEREFDELQQQLFDIKKILRKHGNSFTLFLEAKENIKNRIHNITHQNEHLENLKKEEEKAYKQYITIAQELRRIRKEKAIQLKRDIESQLHELVLKNAKFSISFSDDENSSGIDKVEFMISMNAGEDVKPLAKVASGGELSRLMLGLKSIFTSLAHIETVIFDEIDNGVSGSVANAIGKKMKELSNDSQVFAVTHLSPVAVWADNHYLVKKKDVDDRTTTNIQLLDKDGVIHELAMISQGNLEDTSIEAAKTLYNKIHKQ